MSTHAAPVTDDLLARLSEEIDAREQKTRSAATVLTLGRRNGKATLHAFLAGNSPDAALRRCDADRKIVETYRITVESPDLHADAWMVMRAVIHYLASAYGVEV